MALAKPVQAQGSWHWRSEPGRLEIEAPSGTTLSELGGVWSIDALEKMLEGLSRGRLRRVFAPGDGPVRCPLRLSNGHDIHLVGAFISETEARGMLLTGEDFPEFDPIDLKPGPDLVPVYQPIISLRDGRVVGFEALARWTGPGLTAPPSRWEDQALASNMLIRAAETLSDLRREARRDDLFVHVNLTARELTKSTIPALIDALTTSYALPKRAIRIELTEQAALRDEANSLAAAMALKAVGAGLVLDDFGTGHSSFAWLADLPFDSLKIDHGLTARLGEARTDTILSTITLLAQRLGMSTTAEGVEKREDAGRLRALGFDNAQGFAFSKGIDAKGALKFLKG
ncbi:MAG: EAL domain-containing protein [Hyphomonas sp.]|jgi:EAL domain-containing protein (putative c-di-GMP-specific phosphodiesterase class I)|uniref:EAL domain-containing protein n=1 Tax=Hyphomonas sp. TaxID=87 RepID=UPI0037C0BE61|nr:EAL domain-containing protein [Hyphomonas sp.]